MIKNSSNLRLRPIRLDTLWHVLPGLALAAIGSLAAVLLSRLASGLSAISVAVVLGIIVANTAQLPRVMGPGLSIAAKQILRIGVVLLGFRLALQDVVALGPGAFFLIVSVSTGTLTGVMWLGRSLGLSRGLSMLAGVGFAICGASAIAAAQGTVKAKEEEVTAALGLVLLFGTISIGLLPLMAGLLDLPSAVAGAWIGASVHDVGQAVAAAEIVGEGALEVAVLVKIGRVLLLGPVMIILAVLMRKEQASKSSSENVRLLPWFVLAFILAVLMRSIDVIPESGLAAIASAEGACFGVALFALGTDVRLSRLRALGWRPVVLGAISWGTLAGAGLLGAHLIV